MLYFLSPGAGCGMSRLPKSDVSSPVSAESDGPGQSPTTLRISSRNEACSACTHASNFGNR